MKFEEVYKLRSEKRITVEEAARMLCMSERNLRRYVERYEEEGIDGLVDKRLAKAAHNAAPVDEVFRLIKMYKSSYLDYNTLHFYDKCRQYHKGTRSYNWVKKILQHQDLKECSKKKGKHRKKRSRQPMPGMMIHQDASTHKLVEGAYWDLVVTMDDATSTIYSYEARGRSERMFGTLQGRLPLELKAAGITQMDNANQFLRVEFLLDFNKRFCVPSQVKYRAFFSLNYDSLVQLTPEEAIKRFV